jgi:hypothetical protein
MRADTKAVILRIAKKALDDHEITFTQYLHIMEDLQKEDDTGPEEND